MAFSWLETLGYVLAAGLVLLVPGSAGLVWFQRAKSGNRDALAWLADAVALSISILALLALWLSIAGVRTGANGLAFFSGAALFALGAGLARAWIGREGPSRVMSGWWKWLLALILFAGFSAWRFYQARELVLPAWVDSVHHSLIVRKIVEYGGLPPDLQPYLPGNFYYHYGFHMATAVFSAITGLGSSEAVLWLGNVINAAVGLSVYKTALTFFAISASGRAEPTPHPAFWHRPTAAALSAALLATFVFQMPAYYLTWGRYTLLTGLILLGPALSAAWELWLGKGGPGVGMRLALLTAGLFMIHYLALLFFAFFLLVMGAAAFARSVHSAQDRQALFRLVAWVALGVLLAAPWTWRVFLATQESIRVRVVNPLSQVESAVQGTASYLKYLVNLIGPRRNHILLGLSALGLVWAFGRSRLRVFAAWALLLGLFSLPWGLRLGPFRPDHYAIALFFPASILLGGLIVSVIDGLSRVVQPGTLERVWFRPLLLYTVMVVFLVWGMGDTQRILNASTILVDRDDLAALNWVKENTPEDARFYINSVHWQGNSSRGVDGGYWLMPYTGRVSLLPPVLYVNAPQAYVAQVNRWVEDSRKLQECDADFWALVEEARLTHVYLHSGKGDLQPAALQECAGIRLVYQNAAVSIFEVKAR